MKHAWGLLLVVAACGPSGEPMKGDIMYTYGTSHPKIAFGAAVEDKNTPGQMLVELGDDNVDCGTNFGSFVLIGGPSGTFVYFSVSATTPGADANAYISAQHTDGGHTSINESSGMVTIDTIDTRVTGSLTFSTTDQDVGAITVSGNFDVKKCF